MSTDHDLTAIARLLDIMDRLRAPGGCPWDAEQTPESLIPYLLEEAHETVEALERGNTHEICDELGDLLLQIVFHARIFSERNAFGFSDIATAIGDKLIRRHPHVFARDTHDDQTELTLQWERIKAGEKNSQGEPRKPLDESLPKSLPALHRTQKLVEKSARHGRAWPAMHETLAQIRSHLARFETEPTDAALGELLFALVLCARHMGIDAEGALRRTTRRHFTPPEQQT